MSKKSFLIFAAGAVAGWTAAQRLFGETQNWSTPSADAFDKGGSTPAPLWESRPESPPTRPVVTGGDPFRGAFAEALAEVNAHADDLADPEAHVA